jgi:4-amino-4-deoxy-L-arabinose transferase-like glycosyltransferase
MILAKYRAWQSQGDRWLLLILLLALGLRTYHIAYPPWDYHNWRQTQTLMVARDFARHHFNLAYPRVQWVGAGGPDKPSYFSGEFSIEGLLAGLLYKLFGEGEALARAVVIAFSLSGIYFLYQLLNRRAGPIAARLGAFIYALLPYHLFFGRAFMPDVPALSLALGGLFFLDRWNEDRRWASLTAAATFAALAILQKLTLLFVGLPVLYLFWLAQGRRLFLRGELYLFMAVVSVPSFIWYRHATVMSHESGFAFVQPGLFGRDLGLWFRSDFAHRILAALSFEAFSPLGLSLFVLGLFWPARGVAFSLFRLWSLGAIVLLLLIPDLLSANYYYLSLLLPSGAALGGLALSQLAPNRTTYPLLALFMAVFAIGAIWSASPLYLHDRAPRDLGVVLNRITTTPELIAGQTGGSPNLLYFADRRGWILTGQYDAGLVEQLAKAGAQYYGDPSTAHLAERPEFFRAMDDRFERLTPDQGPWPIYRLSAQPRPAQQQPDREIQHVSHVNFGNQIELLSARLQKLTNSPTSFELVCFWRFLTKPAMNLKVFLDITVPGNEIPYRASYSLAQYWDREKWDTGEIFREQRIVVLPGSLQKGTYRIMAGCFDSAHTVQLPIVTLAARQEHDFVHMGEIEIQKTPSYGWFSAN